MSRVERPSEEIEEYVSVMSTGCDTPFYEIPQGYTNDLLLKFDHNYDVHDRNGNVIGVTDVFTSQPYDVAQAKHFIIHKALIKSLIRLYNKDKTMTSLELQDIVDEFEHHATKWDYSMDRTTLISFLNEKYPNLTQKDIDTAVDFSRL